MAPTKLWTFTVEGIGGFPFDMLRHDRCWPGSESEVPKLNDFHAGDYVSPRRVGLVGNNKPNAERWESFGWTVLEARPY
jgi:hypothetical protein